MFMIPKCKAIAHQRRRLKEELDFPFTKSAFRIAKDTRSSKHQSLILYYPYIPAKYALGPYTGKSTNVHSESRPLNSAMVQDCFRPHQAHTEALSSKHAHSWASTNKGLAITHVLKTHKAALSQKLHFDHPRRATQSFIVPEALFVFTF
jgi:hypothetical protein